MCFFLVKILDGSNSSSSSSGSIRGFFFGGLSVSSSEDSRKTGRRNQ